MLKSDKLLYFKYEGSKKDSCQRGTISLKDCQIICPFLEYDNRPVSFRVERMFLIVYLAIVCFLDHTMNLEVYLKTGSPSCCPQHLLRLLSSVVLCCLIVGN